MEQFFKINFVKAIKVILLLLLLISIVGLYYLYWRGQCREFMPTMNGELPYLPVTDGKLIVKPQIIKCPDIFNPFGWKKFQMEYQIKLDDLQKGGS